MPVYADYCASTPCLEDAADLVRRLLTEDFGNPSSRHYPAGRRARGQLDLARERVGEALAAGPDEIVFTSGATEALNQAIFGVVERMMPERRRLVVAATEHSAVLAAADRCRRAGADVHLAPVGRDGTLKLTALEELLEHRTTSLVCCMAVNNETGVVHDVPAVCDRAHAKGALVLCDASQAPGRIAFDVATAGCDLAVLSSHKIYGPKGAGALRIRSGLGLDPLIHGGGQERGLRSGTENVPAIAGFGLALARATEELDRRRDHLAGLQRRLENGLRERVEGLRIHGAEAERGPGITMLTVDGLPPGLLRQLATVAASGGSSCASAEKQPSHVLLAMGVEASEARNALRLSLGLPTIEADVDEIVEAVAKACARLRDRLR